MNKFKLFIENFLVYGLGGIISKIVPLIMIPIITRLMPNSTYFGISDMSNTIISFASALAVLGMYDAMYRIFFDKDDEEYKKDVCSTTLLFTLVTSIIVFVIMIVLREKISKIFFGSIDYQRIVCITALATLVTATNNIISAPTRMQNKRKVFLIINTLSPILSYSIAIPLLLRGHYLIALPLASAISGIIIEIAFACMNRKWFKFKKIDKNMLKQLLMIAIPLFPNFLIYWIYNSFDKVMITNMLGIGESGVYAVGAKIGAISQLIYLAFAGGWQYFSFSTMKEKNQVKLNSLIYEYLGIISYIATILMCSCSYLLFKIIFEEEYLKAYIVAPYLFMAPLLQMLFQVACNQFLIIKKTWPNLFILIVGAIINIILNYVLIPLIGIEGAAIATLIGYAISNIIAIIVLSKMKLMIVSERMMFSTIIAFLYIILWRIWLINNIIINVIAIILVMIVYILFFRNEILVVLNTIKRKCEKVNKRFMIRELREKDALFMHEWMKDENVTENLKADFKNKTVEDCKKFIKDSLNNENNLHYAIVNEQDEYLGTVSLKNINKDDSSAEFAITIRRKAMGTGCATYAMKEIMRRGFEKLNLNYIYWYVDQKNERAVRFYDKNNYKRIDFEKVINICHNVKNDCNDNYIWYMEIK